VFGYFNRNWEEELDVPIGSNNNIEPGGPDHGQPTHFYTRRQRMVFHVKVPKDFGKKELVWTLTVRGSTVSAYGTLDPGYVVQAGMSGTGGGGCESGNFNCGGKPPVVRLEGEPMRTVKVGEPLSLNAFVSDDGLPKPPSDVGDRPGYTGAGLRAAWYVYRGPADQVTFEPKQYEFYKFYLGERGRTPLVGQRGSRVMPEMMASPPLPADGSKQPVRVTFRAPGTYVIQLWAYDGRDKTVENVTVTVTP